MANINEVEQKILMTIQELSAALQVPVQTIYCWTSNKLIPFMKMGKHVRFDLDDVLTYFKRKTKSDCAQQYIAVEQSSKKSSLKTKYTGDSHNGEK